MKFRLVVAAIVALTLSAPDGEARQHRSTAVKNAFKKANPCPANDHRSGSCPGFVIDHVVPLCAGGPDAVANMQWQTVPEGKAKDRLERLQCRKPGI